MIQANLPDWLRIKIAILGNLQEIVTAEDSCGPKTQALVMFYQRLCGLNSTGIVGPRMLAALGLDLGKDSDGESLHKAE